MKTNTFIYYRRFKGVIHLEGSGSLPLPREMIKELLAPLCLWETDERSDL